MLTPEHSRVVAASRAHLDLGFRFEQAGAFDRALEAYRDALVSSIGAEEQIEARLRIARVLRGMSAWEESHRESAEAIRLADEIGADDLAAEAMNVEVGTLQSRGSFDGADELLHAAIARARSPRVRGITLQNLGRGAAERGDFATADRYFGESIEEFRAAEYSIGLAVALANGAKAAADKGDVHRSIEMGDEALVLARRLNAIDILLTTVQNQAAALVTIGRLDAAEELLTEALGHFTSAQNTVRQAECLEVMGTLSEQRPDFKTAERCYSRARDLAVASQDSLLVSRLTARLEAIALLQEATDGIV